MINATARQMSNKQRKQRHRGSLDRRWYSLALLTKRTERISTNKEQLPKKYKVLRWNCALCVGARYESSIVGSYVSKNRESTVRQSKCIVNNSFENVSHSFIRNPEDSGTDLFGADRPPTAIGDYKKKKVKQRNGNFIEQTSHIPVVSCLYFVSLS